MTVSPSIRRGPARVASVPDFEIAVELEHWRRTLLEIQTDGPIMSATWDMIHYLEGEMEERAGKAYRRARAPHDGDKLLDAVKARADILSVIGTRANGHAMGASRRQGKAVVMLCPLHSEKSGSFTVWPDEGRWRCFGCGQFGDSIDFVQLIEGLDFYPALLRLADEFGIERPSARPEARPVWETYRE